MSDTSDSNFNADGNVQKIVLPTSYGDTITECENQAETTIDGAFSRLFKSSHTQKKLSKETDTEGVEYRHSVYQPKEISDIPHVEISNDSFDMNTFPRGKVTLINMSDFHENLCLSKRVGTDKDAEDLCSLFLDLGFIVDRHDNPSVKQIKKIVRAAASEDYSKLSCYAFIALSHGEEGGIIYGTDGEIDIAEITKSFCVTGLAGKPKFFIFQACRGKECMEAIKVIPESGFLERDGPVRKIEPKEMVLTLPAEADFLYAYSTVPEYFSFRSATGSWFIQAMCSIFRQYAHKMEVYRMFTRVNAKIAERKSDTKDRSMRGKRQIASIVSQMRKDFFLHPVYGPLDP